VAGAWRKPAEWQRRVGPHELAERFFWAGLPEDPQVSLIRRRSGGVSTGGDPCGDPKSG